jgi:hypothetical protein
MRVRSFQLLNHTIKITYPRSILHEGERILGDCLPDTGKLKVATIAPADGGQIPSSNIEHNRWHEQVHLMFKLAGRDDLYEDEILVDTLAGYLAQYEATAKRK